MKTPAECADMTEIRAAIDEIDYEIVSLLGRRKEYVEQASIFKRNETEVRAPNRVGFMVLERRVWAKEKGLCPDFIEDLFLKMVGYFISEEREKYKQENI